MAQAQNLEGVAFYDIEEFSVNEYHPLPNGQGDPTQVHLWFKVVGSDPVFCMRFKSGPGMDYLITALITHRRSVFGPPVPAQQDTTMPALTGRETRCLQLMAHGLTNTEIAKTMALAESTISRTITAILAALDTTRRPRAVAEGMRWGLIE